MASQTGFDLGQPNELRPQNARLWKVSLEEKKERKWMRDGQIEGSKEESNGDSGTIEVQQDYGSDIWLCKMGRDQVAKRPC